MSTESEDRKEKKTESGIKDGCTCSILTLNDIPGAVLTKDPGKCKVTELKWWLKCRSKRVKTSETKAHLCSRVRKAMASKEQFVVNDPDPGKCHALQKQIKCPKCKTVQRNTSSVEIKECKSFEADKKSMTMKNWTRSTSALPELFSHIMITEHAKSTGKNAHYVEKPIEKGYKFFWDGYLHDVHCAKEDNFTFVKAKCHRSQKKHEPPHSLSVKLNMKTGYVNESKCSCVAGVGGHCNHVFALLYSIDHAKKIKLQEFPPNTTCTQKPAEWSKCRTAGVSSEPIMECRVVKPKYGSSSTGIKSTLYNAVRSEENPNGADLFSSLKETDRNLAFFSVYNSSVEDTVKTRLGNLVPKGSVLSYQLSMTEGNFRVVENINCENARPNLDTQSNPIDPPPFPWGDNCPEKNVPIEIQSELKLNISQMEANKLEIDTRGQTSSEKWFDERRKRLTASKFGLAMKRKTSKNEKFVKNTIIGKRDLSKVPAVKYGIENEDNAKLKYKQYMQRARNSVSLYQCGLFVNPKMSWSGASPDGKVYDSKHGYGLLEVKCAYRHRDVPPIDACDDPTFFCQRNESGLPSLKKDHHYFAQVQGQLGICGAKWCDFVVYSNKGMTIQRIQFDNVFFSAMIDKLYSFYTTHIIPVLCESDNDLVNADE